jgi:hypothetical protein
VTARTPVDLWRLLLTRASELVGAPGERLVDEDGDVHLADSPFGVWGRLSRRATSGGEIGLVFVLTPVGELEASVEIDEVVRGIVAGRAFVYSFGGAAIQLFAPRPVATLEDPDDFRREFDAAVAIGKEIVSAIQPRFGGLTTEQSRILRGWRGTSDEVAAVLGAVTAETGSRFLAHGWDPRRESPPLLISEERCEWGWARRFVTVEADGSIRLRSTIPGTRDGVRGFALAVRRLNSGEAATWAGRLGLDAGPGPLRAGRVQSLSGRPWQELWAATDGLSHDSGDAWQPVEG